VFEQADDGAVVSGGRASAPNEATSWCPVYVCTEGAARRIDPEAPDASEYADELADDAAARCARIACSKWPTCASARTY
jgi:hypothetical protein